MFFIGSIGGAGAVADAAFLIVLIIILKVDEIKEHCSKRRSQMGQANSGATTTTGVAGAGDSFLKILGKVLKGK